GPFGRGLVYAGASKYIDLMPQIKRVFSEQLMGLEENELAEYQDYYYSTDRSQWYQVSYKDGTYSTKKISSPQGRSLHENTIYSRTINKETRWQIKLRRKSE